MSKTVLPSPDKLEQDHLRKVEKDVLIPKKLRTLGIKLCAEYVEAFTECCKGRTLSMVWKCRKESTQMQDCLKEKFVTCCVLLPLYHRLAVGSTIPTCMTSVSKNTCRKEKNLDEQVLERK